MKIKVDDVIKIMDKDQNDRSLELFGKGKSLLQIKEISSQYGITSSK